jgi:ferric-dicitrate binding protein FerR (iron transport regulator)
MTFNKKDISALILKNEYDACTPEELLVLEQWYNSLDDKAKLENFDNSNKELKKNHIWEAVNAKIDAIEIEQAPVVEFTRGKSVLYYMVRIAAMLILVVGSYFTFNWFSNKNIHDAVDTTVYLSQVNNSNGPKKIILPDNSLLWLDANASIKYPDHFTNKRNISLLAGRVFFNVAHDSSKPFTVETEGGLKTTVLGTAFVIEQGSADKSIKVSVLRGKVQVADNDAKYATLTRNEGVEVNINSKTANLLVVDSLAMTGWFSSKVVLDNVTLKEVAASIKENFGYTIEFSSSKLSKKPCSITYNATDNVDDILVLLDKIYHTKHRFSDSTIYIKLTR